MNLPNLSQIYEIVSWHKERDKEPGKGVGIFVPLPQDLAKMIPTDGREQEDSSPHHITVLYIGDLNPHFEGKLTNIIQNICSKMKPFKAKLGSKPRRFYNDKEQTVLHLPVFSQKLKKLHHTFKDELLKNMIAVKDKYPEYKPHSTLEYVNEGERSKYRKFRFSENKEFMVEGVWVWRNE